jgi:hypothetical protein
MNTELENLHREAMSIASQAFVVRLQGQDSVAQDLTREAFHKEKQVALSVVDNYDLEPTRSVLFRSAASLALECNELREAEKLVCAGLMGDPPYEIAEELRDLLEKVNFQRHLDLREISISNNEFQLSLTGDSIGFGLVRASEYSPRVKSIESLIYRTEERKRGISFRKQGPPKKDVKDDIDIYVSVPRAASFAVTFRLGMQAQLPGLGLTDELLRILFHSLRLFNNSDIEALKELIPKKDYLHNFVALAKTLSPDGKQVKTVGFTAVTNGQEERIVMSTPREETMKIVEEVDLATGSSSEEELPIMLRGRLMEASSANQKQGFLTIIDSQDIKHNIRAPLEVMADIVKPLYEDMVVLEGVQKRGYIQMRDIYPQS